MKPYYFNTKITEITKVSCFMRSERFPFTMIVSKNIFDMDVFKYLPPL